MDNSIAMIKNKIYTIRSKQVMLDRDLAQLYGVKPIRLREQVKRNIKRFPDDFMFVLDENEIDFMVSQNAIPSKQHLGGSKPYVFTEQGVSMLSAVLKTDLAVDMSIKIIRAFVSMRQFLVNNASLFQKIDQIEKRQLNYEIKTDEKIDKVFQALENKTIKPSQGIFYDGEIFRGNFFAKAKTAFASFDAYEFVSDIVKSAKKEIILLDNYIDKKEVYHIGASLKDLGTKWFAFSKMDVKSVGILDRLEGV